MDRGGFPGLEAKELKEVARTGPIVRVASIPDWLESGPSGNGFRFHQRMTQFA